MYEDDLQLGKLKESCLLLKLYHKLNVSEPSIVAGTSMVRASHQRSEGCGFDSRLGLRNIFLSLR